MYKTHFLSKGREGLPYKPDGNARCTFYGLKVVLVALRVLSLKRSTEGAFAIPFRVLS